MNEVPGLPPLPDATRQKIERLKGINRLAEQQLNEIKETALAYDFSGGIPYHEPLLGGYFHLVPTRETLPKMWQLYNQEVEPKAPATEGDWVGFVLLWKRQYMLTQLGILTGLDHQIEKTQIYGNAKIILKPATALDFDGFHLVRLAKPVLEDHSQTGLTEYLVVGFDDRLLIAYLTGLAAVFQP